MWHIDVTKLANSSGRMIYLRVYFVMKQTYPLKSFLLKSLNIRDEFRTQQNLSDGIFCENS